MIVTVHFIAKTNIRGPEPFHCFLRLWFQLAGEPTNQLQPPKSHVWYFYLGSSLLLGKALLFTNNFLFVFMICAFR